MIDKGLVKKNFSQAAKTYDQYAVVQRYMGQQLLNKLALNKEVENILEIGAGTGLFTERLMEFFSESQYLLVDISPAMIKKCQKRFEENNNINYLAADGEQLDLKEKFDLIISNAAFQWFKNLEKTVSSYKKNLTENGTIAFSTFGNKNFYELRTIISEISSSKKYSQEFFSKKELEKILSSQFVKVKIEEEKYIERFSKVMDFLQSIKKIGANSAREDKKKLTKELLKRLEKRYQARFSSNGQIKVTYHLLYVILKK